MSEKRANKEYGESEVVSDPISNQSDQHDRGHDRDGQKDPSTRQRWAETPDGHT